LIGGSARSDARSAVLVGRTTADLVRNVFVVTLMTFVGFLVGFNITPLLLGLLAGLRSCSCCVRPVVAVTLLGLMRRTPRPRRRCSSPSSPSSCCVGGIRAVSTMPGWLSRSPATARLGGDRGGRAVRARQGTASLVIKALYLDRRDGAC
jgi:hypothetical protein